MVQSNVKDTVLIQTYTKDIRSTLMGMAIIMIVMFHVSQTLQTNDIVAKMSCYIFGDGWVGVDMFFLLSAYGLCYSYKSNSILTFYKRRFMRLYPMYTLAVVVGICLGNDGGGKLWTFFSQITGLALFNSSESLLWYIEAIIFLYIGFPLFFKLCKMLFERGIWLFMIICILTYASLLVIDDYWIQITVKRIPVIMLGVFTYLCDEYSQKRKMYLYYGSLCLLAIIPLLKSMCFYVPAFMLLLARTNMKMSFLNFLGRHTLEIYIAQHFSLFVFVNLEELNTAIQICLYVIAVASLSTCLFYFDKAVKNVLILRRYT